MIDFDFLLISDLTQKQIAEDLKCSICLGVVRQPGVMCGSCDKIFCEFCMHDVVIQHEKTYVQENMVGLGDMSF